MCTNLTPLGDIRRGQKRGPTDVQVGIVLVNMINFVVNLYTQFDIAPTPETNLHAVRASAMAQKFDGSGSDPFSSNNSDVDRCRYIYLLLAL